MVVGEVVVVVVVGEVVLEVEGAGVITKYAAIPAMTRITTMTMTAVVVLIALCLMIFILTFISPRDYKRVDRLRKRQDSSSKRPGGVGHFHRVRPFAEKFDADVPPKGLWHSGQALTTYKK